MPSAQVSRLRLRKAESLLKEAQLAGVEDETFQPRPT